MSNDEMRQRAEENLRDIKAGDTYMASEVLTLSGWVIELLARIDSQNDELDFLGERERRRIQAEDDAGF